MGVVHDAVEDRVRKGRLADQVVPGGNGELARDGTVQGQT
jgi:hypothetical protein